MNNTEKYIMYGAGAIGAYLIYNTYMKHNAQSGSTNHTPPAQPNGGKPSTGSTNNSWLDTIKNDGGLISKGWNAVKDIFGGGSSTDSTPTWDGTITTSDVPEGPPAPDDYSSGDIVDSTDFGDGVSIVDDSSIDTGDLFG